MFIVCDNVLCWLSQTYHNPPLLSWLGTDSERCSGALTEFPSKKTMKINLLRNMLIFTTLFITSIWCWWSGGLIQLNHGKPQPLQYVVKAAFLASLYADYMNESNIPGWYCGSIFISSSSLRHFATHQVLPQNFTKPKYPLTAFIGNLTYLS